MASLHESIGRLYAAFTAVSKPRRIDGCPCCVDSKELDTLLSNRLRDLTPRELASYASSAFLTVGGAADYLYFLPRILEITAAEPGWWPSPEVTGRAVRASMPGRWSPGQRDALASYLAVAVGEAIRGGDYLRVDTWICAAAQAGADVRPLLGLVARCPAAILAYFELNAESLPRGKLSNRFWEPPCSGHDAVVRWFHSAEIAQVPFEAYGYALTRVV